MKKKLNSTFCALTVTALVSAVMLSGCSGNTAAPETGAAAKDTAGQKLKVMASFYPMYDFAVKIGDDKAEVTNMVPAGMEPHDWEPAAGDIKNLEEADLFAYSGAGMEHWVEDVLASLETQKLVSVEASEGLTLRAGHSHEEEEHEGAEEHAEEEEHDHGEFDMYG